MKIISEKGTVLLLVTLTFIYSCKKRSNVEYKQQKVVFYYNNGKIFCEGYHSVNIKTGKPINTIGKWTFYFTNGSIEIIKEYDKNGELLNYKRYSENGNMRHSIIVQDNTTFENIYYENGKIEEETIEVIEEIHSDEDTYEVVNSTKNFYHKNGQLKEQYLLKDGSRYGNRIMYDENGKEILTLNYKNGFINSNNAIH